MADSLIIVDKPAGIPVHANTYVRPERTLVYRLAKITGDEIFSVHRLDAITSGAMVFARNARTAAALSRFFRERKIGKRYLALVRGYLTGTGTIDTPLLPENGTEAQEALTRYVCLGTTEIPVPVGRYATARYSLVEAELVTGRPQQARRHLQNSGHPVIGDKVHGDRVHNRYFRERFGSDRAFLRAYRLSLPFPGEDGTKIEAVAGIDEFWRSLLRDIGMPWPADHPLEPSVRILPP